MRVGGDGLACAMLSSASSLSCTSYWYCIETAPCGHFAWMSRSLLMLVLAKGWGWGATVGSVLSAEVPSPECSCLLAGEMGQHLLVVGEVGGQGDAPKCPRRFQAVFPSTQGICFLLVVSE